MILRSYPPFAVLCAVVVSVAWPQIARAQSAPVEATVITTFRPGSSETRFGALEFVGGLELSSSEPLFGAWSAIRFLPDGQRFLGVLDTGHWISGEVRRDAEGRLSTLSDVMISAMLDADGRGDQRKYNVDAESLAIRGEDVLVGYEQRHRVSGYRPLSAVEKARPFRMSFPLPFPVGELRNNGGLETLALSAPESPLQGGLITVAEKSVDGNGDLFAGILDGPLAGAFRVAAHDGFDVTDGDFLPDGDLLLLERRFTLATGVGLRIRRIDGASLRPGTVVDGEVILEAGMGEEIDNMEGLDVVAAVDGSTRIILVSDDNHSILQRNLMLEFRLVD
ncbi:esterase-like activity of phytase family protein [Ciceribacter selenitireducens]|nr:esterase-like activity of phytase family protein [Ciceribacter selenitireducens]